MDLISVIVPVYKVEQYLNKCVESIVNQSYTNLEIILVDDGSPDNCPRMCDEWARKDARIKVIHKANGGLSDARNAGLKIATGEYIGFVDSDDWIHEEFVAILYNAILQYNSNLSACDVDFVYEFVARNSVSTPIKTILNTREQALDNLIKGTGFRAVVWNKLYHKDLLSNESFRFDKYHEDEFFTYRILAKSTNPVYVDAKLYNYFQRENGIVHSVSEKHLDSLDAYIERLDFFKTNFPALFVKDLPSVCVACLNAYIDTNKFSVETRKNCRKRIINVRNKIHVPISLFLKLDFKAQIYIVASNRLVMPWISKFIYLKRSGRK